MLSDSTSVNNLFLTVNLPSTLCATSAIAHTDTLDGPSSSSSDYSALSALFQRTVSSTSSFPSLSELGEEMCSLALFSRHISGPVHIELWHLRALKFGSRSLVGWCAVRGREDYHQFPSKARPERRLGTRNRRNDFWAFRALSAQTIIGLREKEREEEQEVVVDADVWVSEKTTGFKEQAEDLDFRAFAKGLTEVSHPSTLGSSRLDWSGLDTIEANKNHVK
ncbi:hypothetical protein BT69DRAFT_464037 [Atractiella rhizophila]|nr:hypothetical protein BT69DRAFT_464037 [Atractiella rhizophila]